MASSFAEREPDGLEPAGGESPSPPAAEAAPTRRRQPRSTSGCCGRWPTWTTCASGSTARSCGSERPSGRGSRPSGCPSSTISTERSSTSPTTSRTRLAAGVRVVRDHALDVLARLGFPRFEDVGERFDPARHEAVGAIEADAPPGTIVAVVRPGYGTPEVILRPAAVVVAQGAS